MIVIWNNINKVSMELNPIFLRYFYSAAQHQSTSKAAKLNSVSQSTINQGINRLEITLGKQLVIPEKKRFQLTDAGNVLMEKCDKIFNIFSEIEEVFSISKGSYRGKVFFACSHSLALSFLPPVLLKLATHHPEVQPVIRLGHAGIITELVKKGQIDIGIILDNVGFSTFQFIELFHGDFKLYCSEKMLKASKNRFILSEEQKEVFILKQHLLEQGISIKNTMEVSSWELIANLVKIGLGIGFLPEYVAKQHILIEADYTIPSIPYRILAIYSKSRPLSPNAQMFLDLIQNL